MNYGRDEDDPNPVHGWIFLGVLAVIALAVCTYCYVKIELRPPIYSPPPEKAEYVAES